MMAQSPRPYRNLVRVWAALLVLLAATCASAYVPMSFGNAIVNLLIAVTKASLVAAVYMHLHKSAALLRLTFAVALFMLLLLLCLSGTDYVTRKTYPSPWQSRTAQR